MYEFKSEFFIVVSLCFLLWEKSIATTNCAAKEECFVSLEIAESLISKSKSILSKSGNFTNSSECPDREKLSVYLDMAKKFIRDAKKGFSTQPVQKVTSTVTTEPVTENPVMTEPVTEISEIRGADGYPRSRDCSDLLLSGHDVSGVYTIWPSCSLSHNRSLEVFCDMETDGGGWTIIQRRGNFTPQENFNRDWKDYKNGFGNVTKDFWLGNDILFILTNQFLYKIRFDLEDTSGNKSYAEYRSFWIDDEWSKYKIHIADYSGSAGDSMSDANYQYFSTRDRENDRWEGDCSRIYKCGWWFKRCGFCNPNGLYEPGVDRANTVHWSGWRQKIGLASTEIKIKRH